MEIYLSAGFAGSSTRSSLSSGTLDHTDSHSPLTQYNNDNLLRYYIKEKKNRTVERKTEGEYRTVGPLNPLGPAFPIRPCRSNTWVKSDIFLHHVQVKEEKTTTTTTTRKYSTSNTQISQYSPKKLNKIEM